jgi:hypothetical protein
VDSLLYITGQKEKEVPALRLFEGTLVLTSKAGRSCIGEVEQEKLDAAAGVIEITMYVAVFTLIRGFIFCLPIYSEY